MTVGYFGIPGKTGGKTHIVEDGKPICGARLHPKSEYQWCSPMELLDPECERCKKKKVDLQKAICKILGKKYPYGKVSVTV